MGRPPDPLLPPFAWPPIRPAGKWQGTRKPRPRRLDPGKMTKPQLVTLLNALAPEYMPRLTTLEDYTAAVRRAERQLRSRNLELVTHVPPAYQHLSWLHVSMYCWAMPVGSLPDLAEDNRATRWTDDLRIVVTRSYNPKQPGSTSYRRYALYRTGMTVGEYLAAVREAGIPTAHQPRDDIKNDFGKGFIRLFRPDGTEVT